MSMKTHVNENVAYTFSPFRKWQQRLRRKASHKAFTQGTYQSHLWVHRTAADPVHTNLYLENPAAYQASAAPLVAVTTVGSYCYLPSNSTCRVEIYAQSSYKSHSRLTSNAKSVCYALVQLMNMPD